jgi:glyoxylase-like metal-dependent hydrolase (beta-lactamase superfamily II)
MHAAFTALGLTVLERGWLSSNNVVFRASTRAPASVIDTGYVSHAAQTVQLVRTALGSAPLQRVINTHLHSDHCGGNAALRAAWACDVYVPAWSFEIARRWDERALSFAYTGQRCARFEVDAALRPGDRLALGASDAWQVHAAPGHDPEALMLFEPNERVLLTADALWRDRLAIVFPELVGEPGFNRARETLECIRKLQPRFVIPGHGAPFAGVDSALKRSAELLETFERDAGKHARYAARALVMFRMLEERRVARSSLISWVAQTAVFTDIRAVAGDTRSPEAAAGAIVDSLLASGHLQARPGSGDIVVVAG